MGKKGKHKEIPVKEAPDIKGAAGAALTVFTESGERGKQKGREKVKQTQFFLTTSQERLEATERRYESICQQNKQFEDRLQEQKEEGDDIAAYLTMRMKGSERLGHMEEIDTIGREKIIAAHQRRLYNLNKEKEATEQYLEEQLEEITKEVVEAEEDLNATTEQYETKMEQVLEVKRLHEVNEIMSLHARELQREVSAAESRLQAVREQVGIVQASTVGGLVPLLILALVTYPRKARMQDQSLTAIQSVLPRNNVKNTADIIEEGGPELITAAMRQHANVDEVQVKACRLIWLLCVQSHGEEPLQDRPPMLAHEPLSPAHAEVAAAAAASNNAGTGQADGARADGSGDEDGQVPATTMSTIELSPGAGSSEEKKAALNAAASELFLPAVPLILSAMGMHCNEPRLLYNASGALHALAACSKGMPHAEIPGAVAMLLAAWSNHMHDIRVAEYCALATFYWARQDENFFSESAQGGVMALLTTGLRTYSATAGAGMSGGGGKGGGDGPGSPGHGGGGGGHSSADMHGTGTGSMPGSPSSPPGPGGGASSSNPAAATAAAAAAAVGGGTLGSPSKLSSVDDPRLHVGVLEALLTCLYLFTMPDKPGFQANIEHVLLEENAPSLQAALKMYYKYSVKMLPGGHVDTTDADKMRMLFAPIVSLMKQDAPQQQQARERRGGASHKRGARHQSPQYAKTHK